MAVDFRFALLQIQRRIKNLEVNPPGGASSLPQLTDVNVTDIKDGDFLTYDTASGKWKNGGTITLGGPF